MRVYIGIDDTDNLETRGTGHQARSLGVSLMEAGLFELHSVTRHQLLVDRRIPFTSHNSSACLVGESYAETGLLINHCRDFLIRESAFDADAGLCIADSENIPAEIMDFGLHAKKEILSLEEAQSLAGRHSIFLDGFLNTRIGMIGSLAAVGLRASRNDGRLLWTKNLRETQGIFRAGEYRHLTGIERIIDRNEKEVSEDAILEITEWCRPVMRKGHITLIVEKTEYNQIYEYISAPKEYIKSISE